MPKVTDGPVSCSLGVPPEVAETIGAGSVTTAGLSAAAAAALGFATSLIFQVVT